MNKIVKQITEKRDTDVIIGATVTISIEQARGILINTQLSGDDFFDDGSFTEAARARMMESRNLLRTIAKAILYKGDAETMTSFGKALIKEQVEAAKSPINKF